MGSGAPCYSRLLPSAAGAAGPRGATRAGHGAGWVGWVLGGLCGPAAGTLVQADGGGTTLVGAAVERNQPPRREGGAPARRGGATSPASAIRSSSPLMSAGWGGSPASHLGAEFEEGGGRAAAGRSARAGGSQQRRQVKGSSRAEHWLPPQGCQTLTHAQVALVGQQRVIAAGRREAGPGFGRRTGWAGGCCHSACSRRCPPPSIRPPALHPASPPVELGVEVHLRRRACGRGGVR